jgi:hypothetical protein
LSQDDDPFDPLLPGPEANRPAGHMWPQRIFEGVVRRSRRADVITFEIRCFRFIVLKFVVTVPEPGKSKAPVYMRAWVDPSQQDAPGSIVIE